MRKPKWKLVASVCAFSATVFVIFGRLAYSYSVQSAVFLSVAGAVIGAIGAPEIEPKAFRYPIVWQMFFSVMGCLLVAIAIDASSDGYALAIAVGLMLGYLAPYWIKHFGP